MPTTHNQSKDPAPVAVDPMGGPAVMCRSAGLRVIASNHERLTPIDPLATSTRKGDA